MTTLHQIGELLRSGVRPTDEETEHLKALGGFVAEMYGRFMGGHAEHMKSASDLWSGRLAGRLSAATGARWEQGIGLAEMLLGSELTSFWQIARDGLTAGYGDFGAEMGLLDLYEEDMPTQVAQESEVAPRRRRASLFGAKSKSPAAARSNATSRDGARQRFQTVSIGDGSEAERSGVSGGENVREARDAHWRDGSRAEMAVIRALAAGGLFVGDQVTKISGPRNPARASRSAVGPSGAAALSAVDGAAGGGGAQQMRPVFLDGVRIDGRTPALASALARVDTVFGRGASGGEIGRASAAVTQSRLGQLTAGTDYSIDRGFGLGERPVYGFYDAAETAYLNLKDDVAASTPEGAPAAVARVSRARAGRTMPASMQAERRAGQATRSAPTQAAGEAAVVRLAAGEAAVVRLAAGEAAVVRLAATRAGHSLSLDQVVQGGGTLRPFTAGVFPQGGEVARSSASRTDSIAFASQITHLPNGLATARVQRGGMSAPRYAVVEAGRTGGDRRFGGGPNVPAGEASFARRDSRGSIGTAPGAPFASGTTAERVAGASSVQSAPGSAPAGRPQIGAASFGSAETFVGAEQQLVLRNEIGGGFVLASLGTTRAQGATASTIMTAAAGAGGALSAVSATAPALGGQATALALGGQVFAEGAANPVGGAVSAAGSMVSPLGAQGAARSTTGAGYAADWRLAIDGGADLPLGATFSRHEVFAGSRASQSAADMRATRNDFRPVIAGGSVERPSELAQALDGMVWVTLPTDGEPMTGAESLGLVAVPSRRRAAMVPAGLALQSIAGVVASSRRAQPVSELGLGVDLRSSGEDPSADGLRSSGDQRPAFALQGRLEGGALSAAEVVRIGQLSEARVAAAAEGVRAGPGMAAPAGIQRQIGVTSASAGGPGLTAGFGTDAAVAGRVAGQMPGRVAFDGMMFAQALRSGFLGDVSSRLVRADAEAQDIGTAESPTFAAVAARGEAGSVSLAGRRIEAALRAEGIERGLRAARFLDGVVGQGGYGRIESERELLSIVQDAVVPVADGGDAPRGRTARTARRLSPATLGRTGAMASTIGTAEIRQRAVRPQSTVETAQVGRAREMAALAVIGGGPDARMSNARVALSRAVVTARESRAVASLFRSLGSSGEGAAPVARDNMLRSVAARGFSQAYKGADEPVLGRLVQRMNASRAEQPMAIANWDVSPAAIERLATLEGAERKNVVRALSAAGWSQPELEMLRIESPKETTAATEGVGAAGAGRPARARADVQQTARASRMGRSMARVLTGGEALGGAVSDKQSGAAAGSIAQGQAAAWLPLLSSGPDSKYFGGLAPTVGGAAVAASLRQALGDLVKMAEAAVSSSDTPVALAARREVLRRASTLESQAAGIGDRATLAQVMSVAASSRAAMLGATGTTEAVGGASLVDQLGGRADVMVGGEQIRGFEDGISGTGALAGGPQIGATLGDVAQRVMQINEVERAMVELERDAPVGLEERLAKALALSTSGPAGARRMTRSMGPARFAAPPTKAETKPRTGIWSREPDEATQVRDTVMNGAAPERRQVRGGAEARQDAAVREEMQRGLSVMLGGVMAPEAMLAGLRSPELSDAIRSVIVRRMSLGEDFVPVLTTLADSGVDLTAARSSISAHIQSELAKKRGGVGSVGERIAEMGNQKAAFQSIGPGTEQFRGGKSALASDAPEQEYLELMAESGDLASQIGASMGRRQRAGLLSAILRGTERAELTAILEQTGGRQFAMAWLNRVDGTRSGIDIGMKGTRQEFGQAFGARQRDSSIAGQSPMSDAALVQTGERAEDKSGLRSIAASVVHTSTGAARPQHGASQAMRRTDWSFVDTGSKASTAHADLGKLASAIVGNSDSGARAPMPLVAPAAKAIAQTALRDDKNSSNASNSTGGSPPAPAGSRGPVDAKMSEKAVEMLAIEMANRVARLMGLTNERRGIWS